MTGQLYGLYIDREKGIEQCSAECRRQLTAIYERGVNYDGFAYPYFDSLLMNGESEPYTIIFGTHSLLWDCDGRLDGTEARPIGFDYRDIRRFLSDQIYIPNDDELLLGGFGELISGATQPWAIREFSRKFCSFCEHIARMGGVKVLGLTGGYVVVRLENEDILDQLKEIYNAKTGGICRVLSRRGSDLENI